MINLQKNKRAIKNNKKNSQEEKQNMHSSSPTSEKIENDDSLKVYYNQFINGATKAINTFYGKVEWILDESEKYKKYGPYVEIATGIALSIFVMGTTSFFLPVLSLAAGVGLYNRFTVCKNPPKEEEKTSSTSSSFMVEKEEHKDEPKLEDFGKRWLKLEMFFNNYKTELYALGLFCATFTPVTVITIPAAMRSGFLIAQQLGLFQPKALKNTHEETF